MTTKRQRSAGDREQATLHETLTQGILDKLAPFEVTVPEAWRRSTRPDTVFAGRCFEQSFHFAVNLPLGLGPNDPDRENVWLVHGEYQVWLRHAWVELPGEVIFDGVTQRFYERRVYYGTVNARPWYMYSPMAALLISAHMPRSADGTIRLGDWHVPLGLPWADPENPTRISHREVIPILEKRGLMPPRSRAGRESKKTGRKR